MVPGAASGSLFTVNVLVVGAQGVLGASFDVVYDPSHVNFFNWSHGELLEADGHAPTYLLSATRPGVLVVGLSRFGEAGGVDSNGTAILIRLTFRAVEAGGSALRFANGDLLQAGPDPGPIPGLEWYGGSVAAH